MWHLIKYYLWLTPYKHTPEQARKEWTAALRSGDFHQAKGTLCNRDTVTGARSYCCLGVACEVMIKLEGAKKLAKANNDTHGPYVAYGEVGITAVLPPEAKDWLGINESAGTFHGGCLTTLNDCGNNTFATIADYIDSRPNGLFNE